MVKKSQINTLVTHLTKAGLTTKVSSWFFEERGDAKVEVRYVGLKLGEEWAEVFSQKNLLLLAFVYSTKRQELQVFFANATPFVLLKSLPIESEMKVEAVLGDLRRELKSDKQAFLHHKDQIGNMYKKLVNHLKK